MIYTNQFVECPICNTIRINRHSESGIAGACSYCRDSIIPNHIPLKQHPKYIKQYLKERHDTEKRFTKRDTKIFQI
jgi:hypothetical protein